MTEERLDQTIKTAFQALSPDDFAKTRVWAKVEAKAAAPKKAKFAWIKYAVPAVLCALVAVAGGRGLLDGRLGIDKLGIHKNVSDNETTGETAATDEAGTEMATYPATAMTTIPEGGIATSTVPMGSQLDAYLLSETDNLITVGGKRYLLSWGAEGTGEIIGTVEDATATELVGWDVYATDVDGMVAIKCYEQPLAAQQWLVYRYVGTVDGDSTMSAWLAEYGITADTVESILLSDDRLSRVVNEDVQTKIIPCRVTITDKARIATILAALSAAEEDLSEVWSRLESHSGGLDTIKLEITLKSSSRRIDLALWPHLNCLPMGYVADEALEECLVIMIDEEWN